MGIVLSAENVSIRYITGDFKDIGLKEYAVRRLTNNYHVKEFMAVDGVSFELQEGDMLGIIGSNGAGKSTLLKAVAGIMEPTQGKITANGDIAALLELGSGFDGDLTVKENAYLRGAMLGYTREFMDRTYEQIIEFAELKEFEDRPFKQLSSGMKSRLAFSIASLVKPDILILDEVLSVGDGAFQEKSAQKMREIITQGTTTILVSHSLSQIRELCNKVLWLDHGRQVAFGETQEICDQYERFLLGEYPSELIRKSSDAGKENFFRHSYEETARNSKENGCMQRNDTKKLESEDKIRSFIGCKKIDQAIRLFIKNHLLLIFFFAITAIALYIRWSCREFESGDYLYYLGWYGQIKDGGGFRALKDQIGNYGEGYMLFLTILTYLPIPLLYGLKGFSVFFDFVAAVAAGAITKKIWTEQGRDARLASVLAYTTVLMLPTVILNSAYWAQSDTVYSAFCLLAILCILHNKPTASFVMLGLALSIKMQVILILPAWILLWYRGKKFTLSHFLIIPGVYAVICIPALLAGRNPRTLLALFGQFGSGAFGFPYAYLNNLSVFLLPTDPYIGNTLVKISTWFTIALVGASMLLWIVKNVDVNDNTTFLALCLFYTVMTTEFLGGLHERHAMLVDIISVVFFFSWKKQKWFIPLVLNAHSFLGYVRYCTSRWDAEMTGIYLTVFMIEAGAYFLFACWLMVMLYREFLSKKEWPLKLTENNSNE